MENSKEISEKKVTEKVEKKAVSHAPPIEKKPIPKKSADKFAIIRIRGECKVDATVTDTMKLLSLHRKNYCSIFPVNSCIKGMITKAKDYITWGILSPETETLLKEKRGEKGSDEKLKPFFRLAPPKGGFERGGIKKPFKNGGALGNRNEKINDLIKRMI